MRCIEQTLTEYLQMQSLVELFMHPDGDLQEIAPNAGMAYHLARTHALDLFRDCALHTFAHLWDARARGAASIARQTSSIRRMTSAEAILTVL